MKNNSNLSWICALAILIGFTAGCVSENQAKLQAQAKVTRADAEKTALGRVPDGTVKEAELEREHGKLVWSFDIATPGTKDITEVHVDAITGEVVDVEKESPDREEKEKKEKE